MRVSQVLAFLQNAPIRCGAYPGFYPGLVCRAPLGLSTRRTHRFVAGHTQGSTLAGMLRPVGAFNTQNAPIRCGLEGVYEVPIADVERLLQVAITVTDEFHVGLEGVCGA